MRALAWVSNHFHSLGELHGQAAIGLTTLGVLGNSAVASNSDWVSYLISGGPFGVVVILLVSDKLTTTGERDRLRAELTAAHEREEKLNNIIRDDYVPILTKVHEATLRSTEVSERVFEHLVSLDPGNRER